MLSGILNSAISGVNVNAQRIASAADNVANVATTSYKPNQINAQTLATAQTSTTSYAPGGVLSSPRTLANVQGLLASSTSSTDMAISGQGYFAVSRQPASNVSPSQALYSRDGSFAPDAQGNLVNGSGYYLLAHKSGENGALSAVNVARVGTSAQASSTISVGANLPSTANVGDVFSVSAQVTDSLGNAHTVQMNFKVQGPGRYQLSIPGAQQNDAAGGSYDVGVQFGGDGAIRGFDTTGDGVVDAQTPPGAYVANGGGAKPQTISLDLGATTQFGGEFVLNSVSSDGATPGGVERVSVSAQGALTATFSNGQTRAIADIPVATFTSPQNLQAVGGNAYQATDASGQPLLGGAGAGQVQGGALELSATDLGTEFASMIVAQSAYSASLKVLAAGEDMARTLLSVRA